VLVDAVVDRDRGLQHLSERLDLRDVLVLGRDGEDVPQLACRLLAPALLIVTRHRRPLGAPGPCRPPLRGSGRSDGLPGDGDGFAGGGDQVQLDVRGGIGEPDDEDFGLRRVRMVQLVDDICGVAVTEARAGYSAR
jgi:hypothetical protein